MTAGTPKQLDSSAIAVAAVCLILQIGYLAEGRKDPTFEIPIVDASGYHQAATGFSRGEPLSDGAFWQPPAFPLFLGCVYRLIGVSVPAARGVLAGIAVLTCVLIWWIGKRVFSRRVGVVAALMWAAYGPFLFFSTRLLPTGLAVFLTALALALWVSCLERPRVYRWLLLGLTIGVATITVPNAVVLVLVAVVGLATPVLQRQQREGPESPVSTATRTPARDAGLSLALILFGAAVPVGAVTIRNYVVAREWVIISTNGGVNFYIGNNPHSERTVAIRPGEYWRRLTRESYSEGARTRAQQSAYFFRRGFAYLTGQPGKALRNLARKSVRLVSSREIPRNVDPYVYRDFSHILSIFLWRAGPFAFPFGLVAPLAALGMVVTLRSPGASRTQRAGRLGLFVFILAYGASVVMFFVTARYRLPAVAVLTLFAAAGAVWVWDYLARWIRNRRRERTRLQYVAGITLVAAMILVNVSVRAPTDGVNFRAELAMCVGHARAAQGDLDLAKERLFHALDVEPRYAEAAAKLAGVVAQQGDADEAERLLRLACEWDERSAETRCLLAETLRLQGRPTEAIAIYEEALAVDPTLGGAYAGLADLLIEMDQIDTAIGYYRSAVDLADDSGYVQYRTGPLLIRLGDALARRGSYEEAIEQYRQGLWRADPEPAALNRIAWLLATCPVVELRDCEQAIEIAERLCRTTSHRQPVALDTLAAAYAECGRLAEAVTWVQRAIDLALAEDDSSAVGSFRSRLRIYEHRLLLQGPKSSIQGSSSQPDKP